MKRTLLVLAKLAITSLLLWWLASKTDLDGLRSSLERLSVHWLLVALLLILLQTVILGWRWHRIIEHLGGRWSAAAAMRWCFVGVFFNQALPSSVGGDAVRVWAMHRDGQSPELSFGSVVIERASGLAVQGLLVSAATAWIAPTLGGGWIVTGLLLAGPAALLGLAVAASLDTALGTRAPEAVARALRGLAGGLRQLARAPLALAEIAGLGLLVAVLSVLAAMVLGRALGVEASAPVYAAMVTGAVLVAVVPVSLGGWGVREATMVALFGLAGAPAEPVLAMSLVWGLLPLLVSLPSGLGWLLSRRR